ncbi:MAG TPA: hypothetical protein VER17_07560 [Tepidisphaeraceae bacterium]|nr:hypothetical protein [Tepidisphaeraceae bacterium]
MLRDQLNTHRNLVVVAAVVLIGGAAFMIFRQMTASDGDLTTDARAFYTTDDGATLFEDDAWKVPPFDRGGKPAVRAFPFSADGGRRRWVQYLQKYPDDVKQKLEAQRGNETPGHASRAAFATGLVKRPGDPAAPWVPESSREGIAIMTPRIPPNMGEGPIQQVAP